MKIATATRHASHARTEVGFDGRKATRRAYARASRRVATAEIDEALDEIAADAADEALAA